MSETEGESVSTVYHQKGGTYSTSPGPTCAPGGGAASVEAAVLVVSVGAEVDGSVEAVAVRVVVEVAMGRR